MSNAWDFCNPIHHLFLSSFYTASQKVATKTIIIENALDNKALGDETFDNSVLNTKLTYTFAC